MLLKCVRNIFCVTEAHSLLGQFAVQASCKLTLTSISRILAASHVSLGRLWLTGQV